MSFFGRVSHANSYLEALLPSNQQPNAQQPIVPSNVAQNALQTPIPVVMSSIAASSTPNLQIASNVQTAAQGVLPQARGPLQDVLNEWARRNPNRLVAVAEISTCISDQNSTLNLANYNSGSLPDVFDYPELQHLHTLILSGNQLTALPASFGQLTALQRLDLTGNRLTVLPDFIGHLTALQRLSLSDNQLTELPTSIGQLTTLENLYLRGNQLTVLPDSIDQLTALQELDLGGNELTVLPDSIDQLTALQALGLGGNQLTALPESFGQLTALLELHLNDNQLTALPASFSQLTALQMFYLTGNQLTALPSFLRALPNLQVHDLPFAVNIASITEEICKLAALQPSEALKHLYAHATDGDGGQKALLRAWLGRLKDTAPGRSRDVNFYKSIVQILELASTNAPFAETFWNVIDDAAITCGDRVALSILDLDIARQLMTLDPQKHLQVADFLKRGVWTYDLLKEIAVDKALTLRAANTTFDEIEVHLGYFIKLKEALNLPITMQEMLYFACSTLTEDDLKAAKNHIIAQISNKDAYADFLIGQDKWKETLKIKHAEELESIEEAYAESEEDPDVALQTYQTALKDLTKELLIEPETRPVTSVKRARIGTRALAGSGINPALQDTPEDGRRKMVTRSSQGNLK